MNLFAGEVAVGFGNQRAVRAEVFDTFGKDFNGYSADADFVGAGGFFDLAAFGFVFRLRVGRHWVIVLFGLVDHHRFAVEIRVTE